MVGGSKRKADWVCGKRLSTRLFADAGYEGPAAVCFLPAGAGGAAQGGEGEAHSGSSVVVADCGNRRVVLLHVPRAPLSLGGL